MSWSTPLTAVANAALTAAQWNASVRDNLNETAPAKATAAGQIFVSTAANAIIARVPSAAGYAGGGQDATNSTTFIALNGGASVTVTTGTQAIVAHGSSMSGDTVGGVASCGYAISGATTVAATDTSAVQNACNASGRVVKASWVTIQGSLNAGSNTFTQQFRSTSGISTFAIRNIVVIPL